MPVNNWNTPQPSAYGSADPALARLDGNAQLWLIVAVAGFFVGTMFITGPLAWFQANKLCQEYRQMGAAPSQNANAARVIGMISTILSIVVIALMCVGGIVGFALYFTQRPR